MCAHTAVLREAERSNLVVQTFWTHIRCTFAKVCVEFKGTVVRVAAWLGRMVAATEFFFGIPKPKKTHWLAAPALVDCDLDTILWE